MVLDKRSKIIYPGENMKIPTYGDIQQCEHQSRAWWDHTKCGNRISKHRMSISYQTPHLLPHVNKSWHFMLRIRLSFITGNCADIKSKPQRSQFLCVQRQREKRLDIGTVSEHQHITSDRIHQQLCRPWSFCVRGGDWKDDQRCSAFFLRPFYARGGVGHRPIRTFTRTSIMMSGPGPHKEKKCRIAEIVQYTCDLKKLPNGRPEAHCFPIPRIFRM
jgi:hypothetical protein